MANAVLAKLRARDLGIPFDGAPGKWNAITDVKGVEVGYHTLIKDTDNSNVRTGVTAIFPRGKQSTDSVFAAWFPLNGNGEMTGTTWIDESGFLNGPVMITNTHSVGVVHDAVIKWQIQHHQLGDGFSLPVVAETWDGYLNDINGQHINENQVFSALNSARSGPLAEGNVGGGTGMRLFEFKGGTGTSSRQLSKAEGGYTIGVLVQANYGLKRQLIISGVPVGKELDSSSNKSIEKSSIIVVIATDAPLLPTQLKRLAKHAAMGIARTGGVAMNSSGDIILAFSTANKGSEHPDITVANLKMLSNEAMNPLFEATIDATEEAIINALIAAETMTGMNHTTIMAAPQSQIREILKKYNRLTA